MNFVICLIFSCLSFEEKKTIKEYHEYRVRITEVKHDDSIN